MKKKVRKVLMYVLLAVFVVSTALAIRQFLDDTAGANSYEEALSVAKQESQSASQVAESAPTPTEMPEPVTIWVPASVEKDAVMEEMESINLSALREVNPDVVGWIRIPDMKIDYPIMQGQDNQFYLEHTWQKEPNSVGSIFMECLNQADLIDYNTIIYGHNMKSGAMFGDLENFSRQWFWESHPYVYIAVDAGVYRYEIFSFFQPEVDSLTYGINPNRDDTKMDFLNLSLENSWIDTGIVPAVTDRILTLSTCSGGNYDYRFVVQARLPMVEVTQ